METIAAIELARAAKAPVRMAFDREEELSVTGYRPAAELKIALLPSAQGELKALSLTAYADTGAAVNSTIAGLARLIYPARGEGARRLRRGQQSAAWLRLPRPRRAADGLRAGTGDRRGRAAHEDVDPIACANAGIPIRTGSGFTTGRLASSCGGHGSRRHRKADATAMGSASLPATGSISGRPAHRSNLRSRAAASIASCAMQDIGTGTRSVIANTVAKAFGP